MPSCPSSCQSKYLHRIVVFLSTGLLSHADVCSLITKISILASFFAIGKEKNSSSLIGRVIFKYDIIPAVSRIIVRPHLGRAT